MLNDTAVHILGGGIGGTVGAILTCPLEVVKVRLQSSQGSALRSGIVISPPKSAPIVLPDNHGRCSARLVRQILSSTSSFRKPSRFAVDSDNFSPFSLLPKSKVRNAPSNSSCQVSLATFMDASHDRPLSPSFVCTGLRRSIVLRCLMDISRDEGFRALFKGFIPTLVGVLPSRGIYFSAYYKGQVFFEGHFPRGSSGIYFCAAGFASIAASSLTNPIWYIKTRLQLDSRPGMPPITVIQVIRNTWRQRGFRGFYRGVTASYVGSLETAVNFVIYENFKASLLLWDRRRQQQLNLTAITSPALSSNTIRPSNTADLRGSLGGSKLNASSDMVLCMVASAFSKVIAITATYPHEVVRTRLREDHVRYRGFIDTIQKVLKDEGAAGLYRGMGTHYIRQVPNSCIMIGTYEVVVFLLQSWGLTRRP